MKNKEEIIITIDVTGKVNVSVNGVKGKSCLKLTEDLEKAVGKTVQTKLTEEYYQNGTTIQQVNRNTCR